MTSALLPNHYPHQRTRQLSQEANVSDGNSSGTETDRTPRAISTASFPSTSSTSSSSHQSSNNTSPASFSSSSTVTGRAPRIRVSTSHRRGQSDLSSVTNLQPLIIGSSLDGTHSTSDILNSFPSTSTPVRRSHGRTPSTIATPPSSSVIQNRKNRASTISSGESPRRSTGLHYKKPSLSTICKLRSMEENLISSVSGAEKVVMPLSGKRRSKALSEALSSRRRSSTISGGPPPSFDGTADEKKTTSPRRSRARGGSVSAVRIVAEVDRDLRLQKSRPLSSIVGRAQELEDTESARLQSRFSTKVPSSPASEMSRSGSSTSFQHSDPGSSPPVDSLDWASYIDEGYNLSPTSSTFSAASLSCRSMSRTTSQATTISTGESLVRSASKDSMSSSASRTSVGSVSRPHSRTNYEPTGVDWLDEELACASSDEEDLLLDFLSFPRPKSRVEPGLDEKRSPKGEAKRVPPSIPLPALVLSKHVSLGSDGLKEGSSSLTFVTPPSSPNPEETVSEYQSEQPPSSSMSQVVASVETECGASSPLHPVQESLTAAQRYARYATGELVQKGEAQDLVQDPVKLLGLQSACQAVFGDAQKPSTVSRRTKKPVTPPSALGLHFHKSLPSIPGELSSTPPPSLPFGLATTASSRSGTTSTFSTVEEEGSSPAPNRRTSSMNRPDTAGSSGSDALSVSTSASNPRWGRASFSTDASSLLGSPCSPRLSLLSGGEAMIKSASADASHTFPMRPPRSPRRGSCNLLPQAGSSTLATSNGSSRLRPALGPRSASVSGAVSGPPSLPPIRPASAFAPKIKLPQSPKNSRGSRRKPLAPVRMTSLANAVAAAPSSEQREEEYPSGLLGGWMSQDDAVPEGRVSPCVGASSEIDSDSDSDSDSGEESWWSGEEGRTGRDGQEIKNESVPNQVPTLLGIPPTPERLRSSSTSPVRAPKLSAAAAKRLGLGIDGTVPSSVAARAKERKEEALKSSVPSYPATPTSSLPSRSTSPFPPFPGTDSNFSDKTFFDNYSLSASSKTPSNSSRIQRMMGRGFKGGDEEIDPLNTERSASSMSRYRFDSKAASRSSVFLADEDAISSGSAVDLASRAASSLGFSTSSVSSSPYHSSASRSQPLKRQPSFLGIRSRSSQNSLESSGPESSTNSLLLDIPSDGPRLKYKLSTGSFGFSQMERNASLLVESSDGKKRFGEGWSSIKMKRGGSRDASINNIFKIWA